MCVEAVLTRFIWFIPVLALGATARPIAAQDVRNLPAQAPVTFTPPAGLCRVWLSGVPASQQPAPTDCASAIKNRPANAAVVFGPKRRSESSELESFTRRGDTPAARTFSPNARGARRDRDARVDDARGNDARGNDARGAAADAAPKPAPKPARKPDKPEKPQ